MRFLGEQKPAVVQPIPYVIIPTLSSKVRQQIRISKRFKGKVVVYDGEFNEVGPLSPKAVCWTDEEDGCPQNDDNDMATPTAAYVVLRKLFAVVRNPSCIVFVNVTPVAVCAMIDFYNNIIMKGSTLNVVILWTLEFMDDMKRIMMKVADACGAEEFALALRRSRDSVCLTDNISILAADNEFTPVSDVTAMDFDDNDGRILEGSCKTTSVGAATPADDIQAGGNRLQDAIIYCAEKRAQNNLNYLDHSDDSEYSDADYYDDDNYEFIQNALAECPYCDVFDFDEHNWSLNPILKRKSEDDPSSFETFNCEEVKHTIDLAIHITPKLTKIDFVLINTIVQKMNGRPKSAWPLVEMSAVVNEIALKHPDYDILAARLVMLEIYSATCSNMLTNMKSCLEKTDMDVKSTLIKVADIISYIIYGRTNITLYICKTQ
ncbi:hypothetical protein EGW08_023447 [Elysia chlorotica]|uniref:Uncharacterized protein n=1 Tax=Elysia chlorotica TaxID=188477 RepID=A0A3S1AW01_ELYCH|nr:hypothetical protein EGW08_023447 [Elysia chlorotica]